MASFHLKGNLITTTVVQLLETDLPQVVTELENTVKENSTFFKNAPILVDLQKLPDSNTNFNFKELRKQMNKLGLILIGIRGGSVQNHRAAGHAGLAIFPVSKNDTELDNPIEVEDTSADSDDASNQTTMATPANDDNEEKTNPQTIKNLKQRSKIITKPVRSEQQVYAKNGDLIVMGPVSHGAELLADGNIHVYGALRGRALAGVAGDNSARIYCQRLEAELISIAGFYQVSENIKPPENQEWVNVYLHDDHLCIDKI